jgi:hypothetical protein
MLIANGIIHSLMQPMIATYLGDKFNRPLMWVDWLFHKCKLIIFHVHMIELHNPKILILPNQAKSAKGKNVIIGEARP